MGFGGAVRACLTKYATFSGRARRPEYWWFVLFTLLAGLVATLLDTGLGLGTSEGGPVSLVASLAFALPGVAAAWRRLHDVGRTGRWMFLPLGASLLAFALAVAAERLGAEDGAAALLLFGMLAVLASWGLLIVWLASRSQPGPNPYGPEPAA